MKGRHIERGQILANVQTFGANERTRRRAVVLGSTQGGKTTVVENFAILETIGTPRLIRVFYKPLKHFRKERYVRVSSFVNR